MKRGVIVLAVGSILCCAALASAQSCVGDLDGNGEVDINEIVRGVACALDASALPGCPAMEITDLVLAVDHALFGCDIVWMQKGVCPQCEPCDDDGIESILRIPAALAAEGVAVLEFRGHLVLILCCGCPSFVYEVLVPATFEDKLISEGWHPF